MKNRKNNSDGGELSPTTKEKTVWLSKLFGQNLSCIRRDAGYSQLALAVEAGHCCPAVALSASAWYYCKEAVFQGVALKTRRACEPAVVLLRLCCLIVTVVLFK
jgi:hypothetical protein